MSSWFSQFRNIFKLEHNPLKVIEVKQDKYSDRLVYSRDNGILLYGPGGKENEFYEVLLLRPCNESMCTAYSIFRSLDISEAEVKFVTYKDKIPVLLNVCKDACKVDSLQKICDVLNENPSWTVAHIAIQLNLLDVLSKPEIKSQLCNPDPISGLYPIHLAVKNANLSAIKNLLKADIPLNVLDQEGNTVHHYAAETNKDIVSILSSKAAECLNYRNAGGNTPLHVACRADKQDCVKALLVAGADVNISSKPLTTPNTLSAANIGKVVKDHDSKLHEDDIKFGGTPLHWSCSKEVICDLVVNNCDLNAVNFNGHTALHIMVLRERLECAIALLSHGCEVNAEDEDGNTPLHLAVQKKNVPLIQGLVIFGAKLDSRNKLGETPRHLAAINIMDTNARKALYTLHAVGAARCGPGDYDKLKNCTAGCHPSGEDCGVAPPEPKSYPARSILALYEQDLRRHHMKGGRLLCLDGGGIRGLVLITILLHLEEAAGQPILDCFDWVSGTSTGGILALALAERKTLRECLWLYFLLKERTFCGNRPYNSEPLESMLKEIFKDKKMSEYKHPKLIITALLADNKPADMHMFRSYTPPCDIAFPQKIQPNGFPPLPPPEEQLVWKAARASGAAPSYFRMFERYLDGGLIANNPTLDTLTEIREYNLAMKYVGRESEAHEPTVVVSVGTGTIPVTEVENIDVFRPGNVVDGIRLIKGANALKTLLIDQATQSDGRVIDRARAWCHFINVPYFRFCPQMSEEINMDEKDDQKLVNMLWETKAYMIAHHEEVLKLVHLLRS
ncbi:85/88 kDa calcium-independent phospholipase A2-like [Planococcus citri]|uniref:85/88 kDa calcium-independent phospholipase A2-like n=1 Tax=Planococcus citri TaxID=170843 RepID=UPI0031F88C84